MPPKRTEKRERFLLRRVGTFAGRIGRPGDAVRRVRLEKHLGKDLRQEVADIISDYREGEITKPDAAHVDRWATQFADNVRNPLLEELAHVLRSTYVNRQKFIEFIKRVVTSPELAGHDPSQFWKNVRFLRLQQAGNSQRDMLEIFDTVLKDAYGFDTAACGADPVAYVYLDDGIFSGGRIKSDLQRWIAHEAPRSATVHVIVMALHRGGQYYARTTIERVAGEAGKSLNFSWWRSIEFEDRKAYTSDSDVLRPRSIPPEAEDYMAQLQYEPVLRTHNRVGTLGLFSSSDGRDLIEQEFLKGGVRVRRTCVHLPEQMRPLGSTWLQMAGFGTMFVTYRNIANNAPLVLWAGNPWYPLFPRRTN